MRRFLDKLNLSAYFIYTYIVAFILLGFIWYLDWILGLIMTPILGVSLYYAISQEQKKTAENEEYIMTLSHRVRKVGEEALLEMPIGILLYSEDYQVEWTNQYLNQFIDNGTSVGQSLDVFSEKLTKAVKEDQESVRFSIDDRSFEVTVRAEERLLYFIDQTDEMVIRKSYYNQRSVIGILYLDNYDDITQPMDDTRKSQVNSRVTSVLSQWAVEHGIYLKRVALDRFTAIMNQEILSELENEKFRILDQVREMVSDNLSNPLTISLGIGYGDKSLPLLGEFAQSALDLALGRGGDQVVIKGKDSKTRFYGGKTNPMEKRTRVRARVVSSALQQLMQEGEQIFIMGHKAPDMDSIGSALGVLNMARANEVGAFVVVDEDDLEVSVARLVNEIKQTELIDYLISPEDALDMITSNSLLIVVDTNRPSLVADERLLAKPDRVIVIDHHRRGEEFIDDLALVYIEPYASSTSELVTELIEHQTTASKLTPLEASALLAGIIVDTQNFNFRTGSRTFDAASYLRSKGADTQLVQRLLEEDLEVYIKRGHLIERTEIYRDYIAIAKADPDQVFGSVVIAKTADTLLSMRNISASFVISQRSDGKIGISARSVGDVNVQLIMEQMGGGGHLTNAATQLEDQSIEEAHQQLLKIIDQMIIGGEE